MAEYKLKSFVLNAFKNITWSIDEAVDYVAYPLIEKGFIQPFLQTIPEEEIKPEQVRSEVRRILDGYINPLRNVKAPLPVALMVILGLIVSVIPTILQTLFAPLLEKMVRQPGNKAFRPTLLAITEILEAHRRGIIPTKDERDEYLARMGLSQQLIDVLDRLQWYIPTAQDVIRFGVREVYTPRIAQQFGLFAEGDDVYEKAKKDLDAAGVDKETFMKYWAAHWELPSITMGFEMLHRGIIDLETMKMLLRAHDVMPFWRDKIIQVAYSPFTRVDVRRMHKLGVLSDEELVRAYMDIGYDEEKAKKLAEFTIRYNADPENSEQTALDRELEEFKKLTKSDLLKGYRLGLFDENEVRSGLVQLGYSEESAEYLIQRENFDVTMDMTDRQVNIIKNYYLTGVWDKPKTIAELGKLALPAKYIDNLMFIWEFEKNLKPKTPSKSELFKFYSEGIIDLETLKKELSNLGYSQKYIDWYSQTLRPKKRK